MTNGLNGQNGHRKKLETQLWNIADSLRGKMNADEFRDYCLGFIFYKYLSERQHLYANEVLEEDGIDFLELDEATGDAYEYLIGQFASGAGKKAGEFYTPQQVSKVLAKIVTTGKSRLKSVYDPTCGSGSLLLRVAREVESVGDFYGQEMNRTTYNLARMNMILHGVHYRNFDLRQEDTLEHPQHEGKRFEAVVANPPFSAKWSANKLFESDDRFS
jgi:type I restriction enzyme M protein